MDKYTAFLKSYEDLPKDKLILEALYAILWTLSNPGGITGDNRTRNEALCAALFFRATGLSGEPEPEAVPREGWADRFLADWGALGKKYDISPRIWNAVRRAIQCEWRGYERPPTIKDFLLDVKRYKARGLGEKSIARLSCIAVQEFAVD